jgi:hypothetical protein
LARFIIPFKSFNEIFADVSTAALNSANSLNDSFELNSKVLSN